MSVKNTQEDPLRCVTQIYTKHRKLMAKGPERPAFKAPLEQKLGLSPKEAYGYFID
jgi:hypothetical protein